MALGGGAFLAQNKILPGAYINFISVAKATANLSDRGIATMPLELDWGLDNQVFEVTNSDFMKNSMKYFGYDYTHEKLKGLRDLFLNVTTLYAYKLTSGGVHANNTFATAKCSGIRGNAFSIVISKNIEDETKFNVKLLLDLIVVDSQVVTSSSELLDNDYVNWSKEATLVVNVGIPLENGTNDIVTGAKHQDYLNKIESYSFNTMGVCTTDPIIKSLYSAFTKRMRDEVGAKFQTVLYQMPADFEGVINLKNNVIGDNESALVYWVTGISAGCPVNKSNLNLKYNGEFIINIDYTQAILTNAILSGEFTLHKVGSDIRVLSDITSLVTTSDTKGDIFKDNQTIRVVDQIANDIASIFNTKYLGVVPNDESGRISLWSDIVKHHQQLQTIRAIENFSDKDIIVSQGDNKKAVIVSDTITIVSAMAQLYMTVKVN